jgi:hypothetical protein
MVSKNKKKKFKNPSNQKNKFLLSFIHHYQYNDPRHDHLRTPACIITVQQTPQLTSQQSDFNNFKNVAPEWWQQS